MTAHQVPPSLGFSRQEHWSGLPPDAKNDSFEKTLMLGKIEGGRRRVQRMVRELHGLDGHECEKLWEIVGDGGG